MRQFVRFVFLVIRNRHRDKNQGQHTEDKRLNEADESFQKEERQRNEIGRQKSDNTEQDFSREYVSE